MSVEIWRSEILLYGFMILNVLGVSTALVWSWRRGLFGASCDPTSPETPGATTKENRDG